MECVAYGRDTDGAFFVQACCGVEHFGQCCDCRLLGAELTENQAKELAEKKAKELNVPVVRW